MIFLAIGAGAIIQVIMVLMRWIGKGGGSDDNGGGGDSSDGINNNSNSSSSHVLSSAPVVSGIAVGMLVMYLTSILV